MRKKLSILILFICVHSFLYAGAKYPELGIVKEYKHLANFMTDILIEKNQEAKNSKDSIVKYIYSTMPIEKLEENIVRNYKALILGHKNKQVRLSNEYEVELNRCKHITRKMAIHVVTNAHSIYIRKNIKTDKISSLLFSKSTSNEEDQVISWIEKEVKKELFFKDTKSSFKLEENDKIYYFNSSDFSWKMMFGKAGYAVFRNDILIKKIVTIKN